MSNVTLTIGGRAFTLACPDGEEAHLSTLGRMVDAKVTAMGTASQTETRMLLFAALMLADEVYEARSTITQRTAEIEHSTQMQTELEARIEQITARLETLASFFESESIAVGP